MSATIVFATLFGQGEAYGSPGRDFLKSQSVTAPPSGAANLCRTYPWACTSGSGKIQTFNMQQVAQINLRVNRQVKEVSDLQQFRTREHWTLPTAYGGDCEDFALLKKQELIKLGFPPQSLLIATVLERNRQGHAVLIVRTSDGDMVLDNLTDRIVPWADTGYIFLRMQDPRAPTRWVSLIGA